MRKIAVIFPGVGYTKDRPLLYYSGKLAVAEGYELYHMDFSGFDWSKEKLKDRDFLMGMLDRCLDITDRSLADLGDISGDDVVFISKSIGTVAATAYEKNCGLKVRQICFSPLEFIEGFVRHQGAALFYGDADPYADHNDIERIGKEKALSMYKISGGNHSLETGDIIKDIDNMSHMMNSVRELIVKGEDDG